MAASNRKLSKLKLALLHRLEPFTKLSEKDREALGRVSRSSVKYIDPRYDIVSEGEKPRFIRLVLDGWACRYKTTPDGNRQIVGFFIAGDFCDVNICVLQQMDHSVGAIGRVTVAEITQEQMEELTSASPRIAQAFWWHELVNASIQREWLLNIGQRSAYERIAHLLMEMFLRMRTVALVRGDSCEFPLTQTDLGDATGLTSVHVNRTLQDLRADGLVELDRRRLRVPDVGALMNASGFNPNYLHLDRAGAHLDAND